MSGTDGVIRLPEAPTPDTPSTGNHRVYVGTDGHLKKVDPTGAVFDYNNATSYSDAQAQNAVGNILEDTATIDFTYVSGVSPSITANVNDASITTAKLADNSVVTSKIVDANVTNSKLADNSVSTSKIQNAAVDNTKLASGSVAQANLQSNSVGTAQIIDANVTNSKMAANSVGTSNIIDANVTNSKLATDSVAQANMQDNSVGTAELIDNSVVNSKLANAAVDNSKLADASVSTSKLQTGAVTTSTIADANVTTAKLATNSVDNTILADNAVTTSKISDGAVVTSKIPDSNITNAKLANGSVDNSKLAANAVLDSNVASGAAIALSKLAALPGHNKALQSDGAGIITESAVTSTELGYVSGVTSAIQTQIDSKQATGNYITGLTSDVSASGPGNVPATVNSVGGSTAANIHSAELAANAATNANTASTIVKRGVAGEIATGAITATSVAASGTVTGSNLSGTNTGDVTLNPVGSSPNANAASLSGQALTLQPADATHPGVVSTGAQTLGGAKTFSSPMTVSDTSTAALTVNSSSLVVDASNNAVGIGTAPSISASLDVVNNSGATKAVQLTGYGSNVGVRGRYANGTLGSPTAANTGNILEFISGRGYGATGFAAASTGIINFVAGALFTDTSMPTYINFQTTPTGSVTSVERVRITPTGNVLINTTTDNGTDSLQVNGSSNVLAGTISGTAGSGFVNYKPQSSAPTTPSSGYKQYADASGRLAWKGTNGFIRVFDAISNTADRTYTLPDSSGTLILDPTTTNGDIVYRAGGILTRLPASSTDGQVLTIASSLPVWADPNIKRMFGGGTDGSITVSGVITLTQNTYYDVVTMVSGGQIITGGYSLYCNKLDLTNADANCINWNGTDGLSATTQTGAANGVSQVNAYLGGGGNGSNGATGTTGAGATAAAVSASSPSNGGQGGKSGAGGTGNGGANAGGAVRAGGTVANNITFDRFEDQFLRGGTLINGGNGGGGGASGGGDGTVTGGGGGGGGNGGGVVAIFAYEIVTGASTPAGVIRATGGKGGNGGKTTPTGNIGGGAGAGGGGGGYLYVIYVKRTGPTVNNGLNASGGNGGNGGNGNGTGIGGNGGFGGDGGRIRLFNATANTSTFNSGNPGNTGTNGSGTTGGTGGSGGTCTLNL